MLAGHLGMTLGELEQRMSAEEFDLWMAYHAQFPIGEMCADFHAGVVASTIANMAGKALKEGKLVTPAEFMPHARRDEPPEEPDPAAHFGAM